METADTLAVKSAWCRAHHAASKTDAPKRPHDDPSTGLDAGRIIPGARRQSTAGTAGDPGKKRRRRAGYARLKRLQAETAAELDALLPSILDKAFRGSL